MALFLLMIVGFRVLLQLLRRLRRWISGDGELKRRLAKRGYEKGQRILTQKQAMTIVRWIG